MLSRQCSPLRSALATKTKGMLLNIVANYTLLDDEAPCPKKVVHKKATPPLVDASLDDDMSEVASAADDDSDVPEIEDEGTERSDEDLDDGCDEDSDTN
eukprot:1174848-Alexandrium_andersonii.AAC.1